MLKSPVRTGGAWWMLLLMRAQLTLTIPGPGGPGLSRLDRNNAYAHPTILRHCARQVNKQHTLPRGCRQPETG